MPTKFSEFFELAPGADDFQQHVYAVVSDATTIVECYFKMYEYICTAVKWVSLKARHDLMDNRVDDSGCNDLVMKDAENYFGVLLDIETAVLFEYLQMLRQDSNTYGANVFALMFDPNKTVEAQTACRQVQLYKQIKEIYNEEYAREQLYHGSNPNTTAPLPNSLIEIDPTQPAKSIDPDDPAQTNQLNKFVGDLVKWVQENHPVLKAVLAETDLFDLVFVQNTLSEEQKSEALETMLDKIRMLADTNPSTKKAFALWVIEDLNSQSLFWGNKGISESYQEILDLRGAFVKNVKKNLEMFQHFQQLFIDFLESTPYQGETVDQAKLRCTTALGYISSIFQTFAPKQKPIIDKYAVMISKALEVIKKDYDQRYTTNLRRAAQPIPKNTSIKSILPNDLADTLKEKADECLRTLPLVLKQDNTEVAFYIVQNFEDLQALNEKSVLVSKANELKSIVKVASDPKEGNDDAWRPIYRSIRFSTAIDCYIAFCNLEELQNGMFYYRRIKDPALAVVPSAVNFGEFLTIDFQKYSISYPGKTQSIYNNDHGEPYRSQGRTVNFYNDLKQKTKWKTISAVRRYDPYFVTNSISPDHPVPHLTGYVSAGRGVTRALPLDDSLCLWLWTCRNQNNRATYAKMGEVLGLPANRQIIVDDPKNLENVGTACLVHIGNTDLEYINYGLLKFRDHGFFCQIIGIGIPMRDKDFFVRVNTPTPGVSSQLTEHKTKNTNKGPSRQLENDPGEILDLFSFRYYRKITSSKDLQGEAVFTEKSKVIQLFRPGDKRMPSDSEDVYWPDKNFHAVGVNLPIAFNLIGNIVRYFLDKQKRGKIINKGESLFRERKPRKDAGAAMSALIPKLKSPLSTNVPRSKLPATTFANGSMRQSTYIQNDWGWLKVASSNCLPVNQEWCHLRGHGDGGQEYPGNFVSGSYHCNTEQLAIETGQRLVTQQQEERNYVLHTTAYLLRDAEDYQSTDDNKRESQILTANYLKNQSVYQDMVNNNIARRTREMTGQGGSFVKKQKTISSPLEQGDVAPVAAYLRYKVMRCTSTTGMGGSKRTRDQEQLTKFFDFIFEGQSEFTDVHQFTIISQAVQFALAGKVAFTNWYEQAVADLKASTTD